MIKFCWKTTCLLAAGLLFGDPWNGELWNCLLLPAYTLIVLFFTFIFQPRIACSSPTANCLLWSIFQFYLFSRRVACFSRSARHWPKLRIVCFDRIIFVWETTSLIDTETFLPRKTKLCQCYSKVALKLSFICLNVFPKLSQNCQKCCPFSSQVVQRGLQKTGCNWWRKGTPIWTQMYIFDRYHK